ncbi:MAG: GatB/YqeY domain-containing protein, partial [Candidatus Woesearchaeota archaeon]
HLIEKGISPTLSVKWVRREIVRVANFHALDIDTLSIAPQQFYDILHLIQEQNITDQTGQKLMELVFDGLQDIPSYVKDNNLIMQNDTQTLQTYAQQAIADSTKAVEDYKQGNENALNYIVGQVMRKTKGTAKPDTIKELLKKLLQE